MMKPLAVLGIGRYEAAEVAAAEAPKLDLSLLEKTLRRGLSDTTRMFMHVARLALHDAALAPESVHTIFASAFGEIATAEALLREAYDANGSSPARFRNSVHNTATGLLSISCKNHLPSTAIAAGWDTVAMALCEASAQLECGAERVLLVLAEESVPHVLSDEHPHGGLAVAFALGPASAPNARAYLTNLRQLAESAPASEHPLAPARNIARAIESRRACTVALGEQPLYVDVRLEAP